MTQALDDNFEAQLAVVDGGGQVVVQISLLATFYLDDAHTPAKREAVAACFDAYLARCGEQLRWAAHPENGTWQALEQQTVPTPQAWFETRNLDENDAWQFYYHGGRQAHEVSPFRVYGMGARAWEPNLSFVSFALPLTWFADHDGQFADMVLAWCRRLQPVHGYGGIGILESPRRALAQQHEKTVYAMARRFPGLEVDNPVTHTLYLAEGIKGVNWLTVIADAWLDKLGGRDALAAQLEEPYTLHAYPGGVMIQAGPRPELGDVNRQRPPQYYPAVARLLKPIRVTTHGRLHAFGGFDQDATEAWLARFDG